MLIFEIIGFISTLACVYLTMKENILAWPIGIIGCLSYLVIFRDANFYGEMSIQIIFIFQSILGWINWSKPKEQLKINKLPKNHFDVHLTFTIFLAFIITLYTLLNFLDVLSTLFSILATYYLIKKIVESWFVWVIVDLILTIVFINKGLYISGLLYAILLILAIKGYFKWDKIYESYEKI